MNEFNISVPPLRRRTEDIVYLAERFIALTNRELKKEVKGLSPAALERLLEYQWPGNVRELRNVIRQAVLTAETQIETEHLRIPDSHLEVGPADSDLVPQYDGTASLKDVVRRTVRQVERRVLVQVLKRTGGNKAKAARILQIDYKTMHNKAKEYGLWLPKRGRFHRRPQEKRR